ncbi:MAG: pgm, partial [Phycisphaerales bacterium]|nr:pgm [Phycisphaerales bacterium]
GVGRIATVSGRFWAMDRDNRWARVEKAYKAIALAEGPTFTTATAAIQYYYDHPSEPGTHGDEFVTPSVITDGNGQPIAKTTDGDSVIFYNYRGDRPRELTKAFVYDTFPYTIEVPAAPAHDKKEKDVPPAPTAVQTISQGFERKKIDLYFVTMAAYEQSLPVHVAYPKLGKMSHILAQVVSDAGLKQFRCAETEKFPHVTFFFNDYREPPFPGEDRAIIPSPKLLPDGSPLTTYDQQPEMSAEGVCQATVDAIKTGQYSLIVVNFANGDMVGHTGSLPAAIKACEVVDGMVGRVIKATQDLGGGLIVTADHGNAEQMVDPQTGGPHTAHTIYTVECIVVDDRYKGHKLRESGRLADVAPTLLKMLGLPQPEEMTGESLIV